MQVAVFHPGTQHSRQTALALQQLDRLAWLATSLFDHPARARLPGAPGRWLDRQYAAYAYPALDPARVRSHGFIELVERAATRVGLHPLADRLDRWGNDRFAQRIADEAVAEGPLALWGFDGTALRAFTDPRLADAPKILDRTIADRRAWNAEREAIAATHSDWLAGSPPAADAALIARDDAEYAAATAIVCGGPFAAESVARHAAARGVADKVRVLPYCWDEALFGGAPAPVAASGPVRFLFAGQVSARKGIQHLLEAFAALPVGSASLTVAGPRQVPERLLAPYADRVDFVGSIPRSAMPALMRSHEVLVLPSHFEGSAVTLLEGLASGLALVHTRQAGTGADDASGVVLDRPESGALAEAMAALVADRPGLLAMRHAALRRAQDFSAARYRDTIAALLADLGL